jgi:hypothetical protein
LLRALRAKDVDGANRRIFNQATFDPSVSPAYQTAQTNKLRWFYAEPSAPVEGKNWLYGDGIVHAQIGAPSILPHLEVKCGEQSDDAENCRRSAYVVATPMCGEFPLSNLVRVPTVRL